MVSQGRSETAPLGKDDLAEELRNDAPSFDFFQAVRLLQRQAPERGGVGGFTLPAEEPVRFSSNPSLGFPAGEIQELEADPGFQPRMTVNFMGLVGNSGVLPYHYSRQVIAEGRERGRGPLRDFLDIFQHRLVSLFYKAWEKGRFFIPFERGEPDPVSARLFDLVGLRNNALRGRLGIPDEDLLFYAGLLGLHQRNATALERIVEDYLQVPVIIEQFVGSWYPLNEESQCRLDDEFDEMTPGLGEHTVVGDEIWDPQARVRLRVGPLSRERYEDFLPGGTSHETLKTLTTFFSDGQFEFEAQLVMKKEEVPPVVLGAEDESATPLGYSSWIRTRSFSRDADETTLIL
jgi:type VI secretion system protein ImpH